jgi:hypothetical protein
MKTFNILLLAGIILFGLSCNSNSKQTETQTAPVEQVSKALKETYDFIRGRTFVGYKGKVENFVEITSAIEYSFYPSNEREGSVQFSVTTTAKSHVESLDREARRSGVGTRPTTKPYYIQQDGSIVIDNRIVFVRSGDYLQSSEYTGDLTGLPINFSRQ